MARKHNRHDLAEEIYRTIKNGLFESGLLKGNSDSHYHANIINILAKIANDIIIDDVEPYLAKQELNKDDIQAVIRVYSKMDNDDDNDECPFCAKMISDCFGCSDDFIPNNKFIENVNSVLRGEK